MALGRNNSTKIILGSSREPGDMLRHTWKAEKKRETLGVYNFIRRCSTNFRVRMLSKLTLTPIPRLVEGKLTPGNLEIE